MFTVRQSDTRGVLPPVVLPGVRGPGAGVPGAGVAGVLHPGEGEQEAEREEEEEGSRHPPQDGNVLHGIRVRKRRGKWWEK